MTYTAFLDNIYTWAAANSGILVIFADQDAPRPNEPYITIKDLSTVMLGHRNYLAPDNITEERIVKYEDEITVSFQSYGNDTVNNLQLLKESLQIESVMYSLIDMNIAVRREEPIRNVSSLVDSVIEKHWSYEVTFGIANTINEETGIIETVEEITGTYDDYPT